MSWGAHESFMYPIFVLKIGVTLTLLRAQQLPSHSSPLLDCIIEVRLSDPSAFACEIASSWHLCVYLLWDSCFSWWLPPHRRLGAAWRRFGTSGACSWPAPVLWGACTFPGGVPLGSTSKLRMSLSYLTSGRFLWRSWRAWVTTTQKNL
jgi:hypothetical protein